MSTSRSSSAKAGPTNPLEGDVVVLDASVLVEIVIQGRHARGADALMTRYAAPERLTLVTAAHGLIEATNALRKLVFRGDIAAVEGRHAIEELAELDLALDSTALRLRRVWSLRERMSAYDAAYAATAEALGAPLLTVDERLRRAAHDADIPALHLRDVGEPPC